MGDLDKLRAEIDSIDRDILDAFERRTAVSRRIGNVKRAGGMETFDASREEAIFEKIRKISGFESRPYTEDLYREIIRLSNPLSACWAVRSRTRIPLRSIIF